MGFAALLTVALFGCGNSQRDVPSLCPGLPKLRMMISVASERKGQSLLIEQQYPDDAATVWRKLLLIGEGRVTSFDPDDGTELPPLPDDVATAPVEKVASLDTIEADCRSGKMRVNEVGDTVVVLPDKAYDGRYRLIPSSKT